MFPRRFGFLGVLGGILLVLLAGGIGFALGAATDGTAGVHYAYWPAWGFGFGFFGLLFPILFFLLIFGAIRGFARGWDGHDGGRWGRGYYGRGDYGRPWQGDVPPAVEEWHRRLHGEQSATTGQGTTPGSTGQGTAPGSARSDTTTF